MRATTTTVTHCEVHANYRHRTTTTPLVAFGQQTQAHRATRLIARRHDDVQHSNLHKVIAYTFSAAASICACISLQHAHQQRTKHLHTERLLPVKVIFGQRMQTNTCVHRLTYILAYWCTVRDQPPRLARQQRCGMCRRACGVCRVSCDDYIGNALPAKPCLLYTRAPMFKKCFPTEWILAHRLSLGKCMRDDH